MRFSFDPESPIMQFLSRLGDLVFLNIVFLVTCLPVFTIGAANAALYDTVSRMDTPKEGKLFPTYFRSFRENFRQGCVVWLILALFALASCLNMVRFSQFDGILGKILFLFSLFMLIISVFVFSYAFPLMSRFANSTRNTLKNALLLSVAQLPRTLLLAAIHVFPWVLLFMNLYAFLRLSFLWFALYFAAAAYFSSRVLNPVLDSLIS